MFVDLARELKKVWYMKLMVMPIIIGALGSHQNTDKGTE